MPQKIVLIQWDTPEEEGWLAEDNIAIALHAYCPNTTFRVIPEQDISYLPLGHSMADDFQHFISYMGYHQLPPEMIQLLRIAYSHAWRPQGKAGVPKAESESGEAA